MLKTCPEYLLADKQIISFILGTKNLKFMSWRISWAGLFTDFTFIYCTINYAKNAFLTSSAEALIRCSAFIKHFFRALSSENGHYSFLKDLYRNQKAQGRKLRRTYIKSSHWIRLRQPIYAVYSHRLGTSHGYFCLNFISFITVLFLR